MWQSNDMVLGEVQSIVEVARHLGYQWVLLAKEKKKQ